MASSILSCVLDHTEAREILEGASEERVGFLLGGKAMHEGQIH